MHGSGDDESFWKSADHGRVIDLLEALWSHGKSLCLNSVRALTLEFLSAGRLGLEDHSSLSGLHLHLQHKRNGPKPSIFSCKVPWYLKSAFHISYSYTWLKILWCWPRPKGEFPKSIFKWEKLSAASSKHNNNNNERLGSFTVHQDRRQLCE